MVGGQLQRGNHLRRAAHDIFFVIKSFVFEHSSKTTDSRSSEFFNFLNRKSVITANDERGKSSAVGGGGGRDTKVTSMRRYLSFIGAWFIILELCRGQGTRFNLGVGFRCVLVGYEVFSPSMNTNCQNSSSSST